MWYDIGVKTDMRTKEAELKTLDINPHVYEHQIFDKEAKKCEMKKSIFNLLIYFYRPLSVLNLQFSEATYFANSPFTSG